MSQFMVLLVEDDPLQRAVLSDVLKGEGFEVVECTTAEAAELVIATSGVEFRAAVVDQNLDGHMLGSELAAFACKMFPRWNFVLMSGNAPPHLPRRLADVPTSAGGQDLLKILVSASKSADGFNNLLPSEWVVFP
jgi:CheY-like chemotaxis protein